MFRRILYHVFSRLFSIWIAWTASDVVSAGDVPPIAAAADLKFALSELAQDFKRESGREVKLSFGSSGNFARQIEQGAPFELFLSADENFVFQLADKGYLVDRGMLYAIGRIVLFVPEGSPLDVKAGLQGLRAALADGRLKRFVIANPEHAPYGRAARAALQTAGLWETIQPKLVFGENASQAMQFAASGSTQGSIVPLSLAQVPETAKLGKFVAIPAQWHAHEPLRQRMALTKKAGETARMFYDYLQKPAARRLFVRYGFVLPGE